MIRSWSQVTNYKSGVESHLGKSNPKSTSQEWHGQMTHPVQEGLGPNFQVPKMGFASVDLGLQSQWKRQCVDAWQLVSEVLVRPSHICMNFALPKCLPHMQELRFSWQVYPAPLLCYCPWVLLRLLVQRLRSAVLPCNGLMLLDPAARGFLR